MTKVRLTRKFAQFLNGIDLSGARPGDDLELSPRDAELLIAEGWAEPAAFRAHPASVLVVDDDHSIHDLMRTFLQGRGHRVTAVDSADRAIDMLRHASYDALVLDVKMPRRSGLDVLRFVRTDPRLRQLPVLIFSGATFNTDEEATIAANRAYIFYKQQGIDEVGEYLERLTH